MLQNGLTTVGIVVPNRKDLPTTLTTKTSRKFGSSLFASKKKLSTVYWVPKKSKLVLSLSNFYHTDTLVDGSKPEAVAFHNNTKAGVDALDQKVDLYFTYHKCKRWPMDVFYNILDTAACNFYISCTLPLPMPGVSNSSYQRRYKHLMTLGEPRIKQNMYVRSQCPNDLNELTITAIRSFDIAAKSQVTAPKVSLIDSEVQPKKALFIYAT